MKIRRLYMLRPRELRAIYESIGGKYSFKERFDRDGNGSPFLYYNGGHPDIDELNERCVDQLRINFEEFKKGLMLGITERTEPYIMPIRPGEILSIKIKLQKEKVMPRSGSFFNWLLSKNIPLAYARFFAGATEYEEPKTLFSMQTMEYPVHAWITADVFNKLIAFFQKSLFKDILEIEN